MVKIRYAELPAGLHVVAESERRGTVVYLLPGLTPAQRRAALDRVRSSALMGQGPPLPALATAVAISADRMRTTIRTSAAALRGHPMLFLPPLMALASGAIVVMLMSFATLTVAPPGNTNPGQVPTLGIDGGAQAADGAHGDPSARTAHHHRGLAGPGRPHRHLPSARSATAPVPYSPGATPAPSPSPSPGQSGSPSPSPSGTCLKLGPLGLCVRV